jgi:hypothetical protein
MKITDSTVSELAFIFKLLPLLQEVETIDRLYRFLLAIVTSGPSVGYERAMLFVPDPEGGVIRGRYGAQRTRSLGELGLDSRGRSEPGSFDEMARSVFRSFENIEADDLTVKTRAYSVPTSWHRSAIVKAFRTTYPVLAERNLSEFATDTFFEFFGVTSYLAVPIEFDHRVMAVLAVDRSGDGPHGSSDEVSVLCSIVHQTAGVAHRILETTSDRRKARILTKTLDSLNQTATAAEFEESLRAVLGMMCRAVEGSVCALKDCSTQKTIYVESPGRTDGKVDAGQLARAMDGILDSVSGLMEPAAGTGSDPRIAEECRDHVAFYFGCPLVAGREGVGALAVCAEKSDTPAKNGDLQRSDRYFIELCAGVIASAIQIRRKLERIGRLEGFIQEIGSNLVRERERARIGDRSIEYHSQLDESLKRLRELLTGEDATQRLAEISEAVEAIQQYSGNYWDSVLTEKTSYAMADLFRLVERAVERWKPEATKMGIQVATRIPASGPQLLLDSENIDDALEKILDTTLSCLGRGDKVLVECSLSGGRAVVCIADSGMGLPGDVVSRLFMPFVDAGEQNQGKRALSLAGDVLQKHSAEILVKSSRSWRTILVLSFPTAAGRDRRKRRSDRRQRRERRAAAGRS